jgi:hypothetical protein
MRQPPSQHQQLHQAANSAAMIMLFMKGIQIAYCTYEYQEESYAGI